MAFTKNKSITQFNSERRKFVTRAGGVITLSVLPETLLAASDFSSSNNISSDFDNTVVIYSANNLVSFTFANTLASYGATTLELAEDPFYTWRNGLSQFIESNKDFRLVGLTNWSEYLLLKGLAAELRRYPLIERKHWLNREKAQSWAEEQARRLVDTSLNQDDLETESFLSEPSRINNKHGYDSYFSWIIS